MSAVSVSVVIPFLSLAAELECSSPLFDSDLVYLMVLAEYFVVVISF